MAFSRALHGGIPRRNETIAHQGIRFTVTEVSRHRIQRCLIQLPSSGEVA
ncbi:MAG: hypothetical protein U0527_15795 [Candidatus Eisenbacteria bacterium]